MQAVLLPFHSLWLWIGYHTKYVPPCQVFLILGTAYSWLAVVCCQTGICTVNMCRLPPRQNAHVYPATPFLFTVSKCHSFTQDKRPSASRRALMDFEGGQPICSHIDYAQDFHFLSSFCLVPIVPPSLFLGDKILPCAAIPTFFAVPNIIFIWEMCHLNAIIQTFLERARFIQFPVLGNMSGSTKYCPSTYGTTHCFAISQ